MTFSAGLSTQTGFTGPQQQEEDSGLPYRPSDDWSDGVSVLNNNDPADNNDVFFWANPNDTLESLGEDNDHGDKNNDHADEQPPHEEVVDTDTGPHHDQDHMVDEQGAVVAPPVLHDEYPNAITVARFPDGEHYSLAGFSSSVRMQLAKIHAESSAPTTQIIPNSTLAFLDLVDMLDDAGAPHYVFEKVINWSVSTSSLTDNFHPNMLPSSRKREGFIKSLRRLVGMEGHERQFNIVNIALETANHAAYVLPVQAKRAGTGPGPYGENTTTETHGNHTLSTQVNLSLYDRSDFNNSHQTEVLRFPFLQQLQDLLDCKALFENEEFLVLNPHSPWIPYKHPPSQPVDGIMTGSWYRETVRSLGLDGIDNYMDWYAKGKPFVLPIVIYVDKTGTDTLCRNNLEPMIFTVGIFKREIQVR